MCKRSVEEKYQFVTNKSENTGIKHFNDPKAFTDT